MVLVDFDVGSIYLFEVLLIVNIIVTVFNAYYMTKMLLEYYSYTE